MCLDDRRACGVGADEDTSSNVADHEGKAKSASGEAADQARENNQDEIGGDAHCVLDDCLLLGNHPELGNP